MKTSVYIGLACLLILLAGCMGGAQKPLGVEICVSGGTATDGVQLYLGDSAMVCTGNTYTAVVEPSSTGFYTLTSVIQGGQVMTPVYIPEKSAGLKLEAEIADGCFLLFKNDADCRALSNYAHLQGLETRKLWTEVKTEEEAKALLSGYGSIVEEACAGNGELSDEVSRYISIWAYVNCYVNITNLSHVLGVKPSELSLKPYDILPPAQDVLDDALALEVPSAMFVIDCELKEFQSLEDKLGALDNIYKVAAVREKVGQYLRDEYQIQGPAVTGASFPEGIVLLDKDGQEMDFSSFKGKYVYVDFWASWCKPCCKEVPYLQELEGSLDNQDVAFLSISVDNSRESWLKRMEELDMHGNQWLDAEGRICDALGITGIPHFAIYDKEGKLLVFNAARPSSGSELKDYLESLK